MKKINKLFIPKVLTNQHIYATIKSQKKGAKSYETVHYDYHDRHHLGIALDSANVVFRIRGKKNGVDKTPFFLKKVLDKQYIMCYNEGTKTKEINNYDDLHNDQTRFRRQT